MRKLHTHHHHMILLMLVLVVLVCGITFGVKLSGATQGTEGMTVISFALSFLSIVLSFLIFTQVMHIKDNVSDLVEAKDAVPLPPVEVKVEPVKKKK